MPEAVIVAATRTPIGRAFKGSLVTARPDDLSGTIIDAALRKVPALDRSEIGDVIMGAANHVGEQGMNLGRNAAALAGLPDTVPGTTVNRGCGSSLQSIRMAHQAIATGEGHAFVAAGVESVSRLPGVYDREAMNPRFLDSGRDDYINDMYISMGETAENVAKKYGVTRRDMDEFALLSQRRAAAAIEAGFFAREITPVTLDDGTVVDRDDCPRPGTTLDGLAALKPAFREDGTVTPGNSCPLNDGAAAVVVMSDVRAAELGITPLARIIGSAVTGLAPEIMGVGPIAAVGELLARHGMRIDDVDVVELNEAFAAQVLPIARELGISIEDQLNPHGGSIALGHPFGMTGTRIMTTLINDLQTLDKQIGLETMCIGGGMGIAMLVERLS
ncbi:acetyl-CoA C-acetyltransferase [Thermomonospora echinospora]|uniref:Acetyl-CoA C-acetyltransferase n=1 Tax=Thermomonospora echinospora TaxID=1992 RepID=A0A1H6E005_9ACTN|nr:acetyl-CoA C-acyltransferase [Thermomonospora echinospora]SEG90443.1 acetyl-CoA C-acetyltransferase [Thermomonospora echinospora]